MVICVYSFNQYHKTIFDRLFNTENKKVFKLILSNILILINVCFFFFLVGCYLKLDKQTTIDNVFQVHSI